MEFSKIPHPKMFLYNAVYDFKKILELLNARLCDCRVLYNLARRQKHACTKVVVSFEIYWLKLHCWHMKYPKAKVIYQLSIMKC